MKKSLLLSIAASAVVFAGGDIAPVQPVQPTAAPAACDFWGTLALRYDAQKLEAKADEFGGKDDSAKLALVMGVEKELGYGFGFGAEVAGLYSASFDPFKKHEAGEVSQFYFTYKYGNTAIKAGRQALPKAVSPLAWTDRTAGIADVTFNGVTVVNTDIENTTLVGAWVESVSNGIGDPDYGSRTRVGDNGIFMLGALTKVSNVDLSFAAYYAKAGNAIPADLTSVWAAATTKVSSVDLGLQVAYSKFKDKDKTLAVAGYVGGEFNGLDAKLTLAFINDGEAPINLGTTSGFWGGTFGGVFGGNVSAAKGKQKIARLDLGYKVANGKVYGGVAVDKSDLPETEVAARIGYDFKVAGVDAKVEYRYYQDGTTAKNKNHRIRVQGVYKF